MSTLLRAWRVVHRARSRPWADGKNFTLGPIPSSATHSALRPDAEATSFQYVGAFNGARHDGYMTRHLGHHRGAETFAFLVVGLGLVRTLHVTLQSIQTHSLDDGQ
jgi:hypothetical protein